MSDVELIKSKLEIVDFISSFITLKKAGRNFKALCPFHSEKTPSFVVSPDRQTWHCFGSCGIGGDVITFYEKWEGVDFLEALKSLAEKTGVNLQKFTADKDSELKEKLYAVNLLASEFFSFLLTKHKIGNRARNYLETRKIKKEIIANFELGYAPSSWDSLKNYLAKKGYKNEDLEIAGLLVKSAGGKYYDRFRGRIIFPLKDARGKIIGFSGRILPASNIDEKEAKYINSPETPLYIKGNNLYGLDSTKEAIRKANYSIIVEGEFDFLASFQSGVTNIVAIKGSALTENQTLLLKRHAESVYLALDSDFAGNEAARRGIEIAENSGLTVKVINLITGKDPAECVEAGVHLWKKSVEEATPIYDFIIKSAFNKYDSKDVNGKKKMMDEITPFLSKIQNPIILSHYIKRLSKELQITDESIESSIELFIRRKNVKTGKISVKKMQKERTVLLEEHLLTLVLQSPDVKGALTNAFKIVNLNDFQENLLKNIFKMLFDYLADKEIFDIKNFNSLVSPEMAPAFDSAYLTDLGNIANKPKELGDEVIKTAGEIKKKSLRREVNEISTKLSQMDNDQHEEEGISMREKIKVLLSKLNDL